MPQGGSSWDAWDLVQGESCTKNGAFKADKNNCSKFFQVNIFFKEGVHISFKGEKHFIFNSASMTSGNLKSVLLVWNSPTRNRGQPWFATGLRQSSVGQDLEESPRKTVNRLRQRDTFRYMGYPITPWGWWSTKLGTLVTMRATSHPSRASAGHISGEITSFLLMFWAL